jgi:Collagen triple helix repeat (20 copies)
MKQKILLAAFLLMAFTTITKAQNNVGVNTSTPHPSAALDVQSTTQGMLVPRMTAAQRDSISLPAAGLLVYQSDAPSGFYFYNGIAWSMLGAAGAQGPKGDSGVAGPQGAQGIQGIQGLQGVKGDSGVAGVQGIQGIQGLQGVKGDSGVAGPQGIQGVQGIQGIQGLQGVKGDSGVAGSQGAQGIQGVQGVKGDSGVAGPQGPQGAQGIQGIQGLQGVKGDSGVAGPQGIQGIQGILGNIGPIGPQGAAGTNGQGVPTGGTANQVLAKIDGTNYNTQWVTPSGGSSLPTQTGNAGKYLKTDGSTASWEPLNPVQMPNAFYGHFAQTTASYFNPFQLNAFLVSGGLSSNAAFLAPSNGTMTMKFNSWIAQAVTIELFEVTPAAGVNNFTENGAALTSLSLAAASGATPVVGTITYTLTGGKLYVFKMPGVTTQAGYHTQFSFQ